MELRKSINIRAERDMILEFLDKYWDVKVRPGATVTEAITYILQEGAAYGAALHEKEAQEIVETHNGLVDTINRKGGSVDAITFERTMSDYDLEGSYQGRMDRIGSTLKRDWGISAKPNDYDSFKQTHDAEEFADIDEVLEFKGVQLHGSMSASGPGFADYLKRSNIFYSEEEQNRPPLSELVGAIFRQGATLGIRGIEQEIGTKKDIYRKIEALQEVAFNSSI